MAALSKLESIEHRDGLLTVLDELIVIDDTPLAPLKGGISAAPLFMPESHAAAD